MIRPATAGDVEAILAISNWAAQHTPANFAIEPESIDEWTDAFARTSRMHPWIVADDEGDVVGFAKSSPWKRRAAYAHTVETTVYVHPDHFGRGVGRALYSALLPILSAQGYRTLVAGIALPNPASVALHESFGFHRVACFERIGFKLDAWHDVAYWTKHVGEGPPGVVRAVAEVEG